MNSKLHWDHGTAVGTPNAIRLLLGDQVIGYVTKGLKHEYWAHLCDRSVGTPAFAVCKLPSDAMGILRKRVENELETALICGLCGHAELSWVKQERRVKVADARYCETCLFWLERVEKAKTNRNLFIAGGQALAIDDEFPRHQGMRGFGGSPHLILFHDGRQIYSTNVWTQGKVPKHMDHLLPNTAELVPVDLGMRDLGGHLPECRCKAVGGSHICWPEPPEVVWARLAASKRGKEAA